jgi:hypothetical protein
MPGAQFITGMEVNVYPPGTFMRIPIAARTFKSLWTANVPTRPVIEGRSVLRIIETCPFGGMVKVFCPITFPFRSSAVMLT